MAADARSWGFFVSAARCAANKASSSPMATAESIALANGFAMLRKRTARTCQARRMRVSQVASGGRDMDMVDRISAVMTLSVDDVVVLGRKDSCECAWCGPATVIVCASGWTLRAGTIYSTRTDAWLLLSREQYIRHRIGVSHDLGTREPHAADMAHGVNLKENDPCFVALYCLLCTCLRCINSAHFLT